MNLIDILSKGFPSDQFPDEIRDFITGFSKGSGSPESFVGTSVLACCAGLMDRCSLEVKYGYIEKPNLFLALVGNPGVAKSPPMKTALKPLAKIDKISHRDYKLRLEEWQKIPAKAKRGIPAPEMPHVKLITDGTTEGLVMNLSKGGDASHAVYFRDELKGHFGGMDKYKSTGGDDHQLWLTLYSGGPVSRVLKAEQIFIPDARATVIGGIQPDVYRESMKDQGDGMVDRFIVAYYDGDPLKTSIFDYVEPEVISGYMEFMDELPNGIEYSLWSLGKGQRGDVLNAIQSFHDWTHELGSSYDCGAFKKWEQNFYKLVMIMSNLWGHHSICVDDIERAKVLAQYYSVNWLKSRMSADDEQMEKIVNKMLKILEKSRTHGAIKRDFRDKIWDFKKANASPKLMDMAIENLMNTGKVKRSKSGRMFLSEFAKGEK